MNSSFEIGEPSGWVHVSGVVSHCLLCKVVSWKKWERFIIILKGWQTIRTSVRPYAGRFYLIFCTFYDNKSRVWGVNVTGLRLSFVSIIENLRKERWNVWIAFGTWLYLWGRGYNNYIVIYTCTKKEQRKKQKGDKKHFKATCLFK